MIVFFFSVFLLPFLESMPLYNHGNSTVNNSRTAVPMDEEFRWTIFELMANLSKGRRRNAKRQEVVNWRRIFGSVVINLIQFNWRRRRNSLSSSSASIESSGGLRGIEMKKKSDNHVKSN